MSMKRQMNKHLFATVTLIGILIVFGNFFFTLHTAQKNYPGLSYYGFPVRFLGDYFTNIYRIKLGQQGTLLYENAYSNENSPLVFFEPHYNLIGIATKPLG